MAAAICDVHFTPESGLSIAVVECPLRAKNRTHQKGGFFHDGRFATLLDVVNHYDTQFNLNLSDANKGIRSSI
jgi:hypothetical protein